MITGFAHTIKDKLIEIIFIRVPFSCFYQSPFFLILFSVVTVIIYFKRVSISESEYNGSKVRDVLD